MPTVLDKSAILELMANNLNRGGYERRIKQFDEANEPFTNNLMDEVEFQGKDVATVRNSFARVAKQFPHLKVLYDKDTEVVVLVNLPLFNASEEEEEAE